MPVEGDSDDDENGGESNDKSKDFTNGSYVYLAKRKQYGIVRSKLSESSLLLKVKTG
jgi:hypothetical protein